MVIHLLLALGVELGRGRLALSLLVTYWAHALVWAVLAALLPRRKWLSHSVQYFFWRLALFTPIVSALLAVALPTVAGRALGSSAVAGEVPVLWLAGSLERTSELAHAGEPEAAARARQRGQLGRVILASLLGVSALRAARLGTALVSLRRRLRGRSVVHEPAVLARLARLIMGNQTTSSASNAVYALSSNDDWLTAEVRASAALGNVYPTTAVLRGREIYVVYSQLNELIQATQDHLGASRGAGTPR